MLLIPGAVVGVIMGTVLITNAPTDTLRTILGVIVMIFALYKLVEKRIMKAMVYHPRDWHGLVAGTITGFSSALAHTGGPPVSIYLLMQEVTPRAFIATSALFFFFLNWIKVPLYLYADLFDLDLLKQIIWLLPLVPLGVVVGRWFAGRVDPVTFEQIIVVLLLVNALVLIFL